MHIIQVGYCSFYALCSNSSDRWSYKNILEGNELDIFFIFNATSRMTILKSNLKLCKEEWRWEKILEIYVNFQYWKEIWKSESKR